jgi:hypothetical protein
LNLRLSSGIGVIAGGLARLRALPLVVFSLLAGAALAQSPSVPVPSLPLPTDFAPAPLALPGSSQAAQKQVSAMLRRFSAVQSADCFLLPQSPSGLLLKVILKPRAGRRIDPSTLATMVEVMKGSVPGVDPRRITVVDTEGALLYQDGQSLVAQVPPRGLLRRYVPLLALALVLALGLAAFVRLRDSRPRPRGLSSVSAQQLTEALAGERPEIIALALSRLPQGTARTVRRRLKRGGGEVPATAPPVAARVAETVVQVLERGVLGRS